MAVEDFFSDTINQWQTGKDAIDRRDDAIAGYEDILGSLQGRMEDADTRAGMSVRDLYGDSIDRSADSVRANANSTKAALARLGSARGGDVSGAQGATFNRVDEGANENVSEIIQYYTDRASTDKEQAQARGDRLMQSMMSGELNRASLAEQELMRQLQQRQAKRQGRMDLIGTLGMGIGTAICWVAEELYGKWSPVTFAVRSYLLACEDEWSATGLFVRAYKRFGRSWAKWVRKSSCVRRVAGWVFGWFRESADGRGETADVSSPCAPFSRCVGTGKGGREVLMKSEV